MSKKSKRSKASTELADKSSSKKKSSGKKTWKLLDKGSTILAGMIAARVSATAWRAATGKKPPSNPRHPEVDNREAITWAILAGIVIELSKVLIRRWAADYWVRSTGNLPPGMKTLKETEKPASPEEDAGSTDRKKKKDKKTRKRNRGK